MIAENEERERQLMKQVENENKNRQLKLKLSKRIRYFAKRGKLEFLQKLLRKLQNKFQGLINAKSNKGCTGNIFYK